MAPFKHAAKYYCLRTPNLDLLNYNYSEQTGLIEIEYKEDAPYPKQEDQRLMTKMEIDRFHQLQFDMQDGKYIIYKGVS